MGSRAWVLETLRRLEVTPVAVLDTHGHWDHVVENHLWAADGLPVWVERRRRGLAGGARRPSTRRSSATRRPLPASRPARLLGDGDVLELGDLRFRDASPRPATRRAAWSPSRRPHGEALVGDLIFAQGIGRTDFPRCDHAAMMRQPGAALRGGPARDAHPPRPRPLGRHAGARRSPSRGCSCEPRRPATPRWRPCARSRTRSCTAASSTSGWWATSTCDGGRVRVAIRLTIAGCPLKAEIQRRVTDALVRPRGRGGRAGHDGRHDRRGAPRAARGPRRRGRGAALPLPGRAAARR